MSRIFTPYEADRTLPLVRSIVTDILECGRALRERCACEESGTNGLRERLGELLGELMRIGCDFKDWDFERGLVDFPSEIDGKKVLLCWRSDEPSISHYHGLVEGFAGRKQIPAHLLSAPHPVES